MKINKILIILSLLLIFCISLATVSATDINVNDTDDSINYNNVNNDLKGDDLNSKSLNSDNSEKTFQDIQNNVLIANDGDTIKFNGYYASEGNPIIINKNLTLEGTNNTIFDAKGLSRILVINANNITIKNIKFINAYWEGSEDNQGGAIYAENSNLVLINATFINNSAMGLYGEGGAIFAKMTNLTIINSTFINNSAFAGGAIHVYLGNFTKIFSSNFSNNYAKYYGGSLYITKELSIDSSNFSNNYAGYRGGAIHISEYDIELGQVNMTNSNFWNNSALNGGVLSISSNSIPQFINCTIFNNNATNGGVVSISSSNGVRIFNSILYNNTADKGGICYSIAKGTITLNNSDIFNNSANFGSIIYHLNGNSRVLNSSIYDNEVLNSLFYIGRGDFEVTNSSIIYNNKNYSECVLYKFETGNIYISSTWWGSSKPDYNVLIDAKKAKIIFNKSMVLLNEWGVDFTEDCGGECCSVILQLDGVNAVINHRRDGGVPLDLFITTDGVIRQQKSQFTYFFLDFINKDGWLVGKGGGDGPAINEKFEAMALEMILNNLISDNYTNWIIKLVEDVKLGHFIIKSPNGTFFACDYKEGKSFNVSGVLNSGDYIICPNGPNYFVIGHIDNITDPIYTSRELIAKDGYGNNRHNDMSYYYGNDDGNISVTIYAANDDASLVENRTDGTPDPIFVNGRYIPSSSIPNIMDGMFVALYNYDSDWIENKSCAINISVENVTYGANSTVNVTVTGIENKSIPSGNVIILVNDTEYDNITLTDGKCSFILPVLDAGDYNITVIYSGNENYTSIENSTILTIIPKTIDIKVAINNITYGEDISGSVNSNMTGTVTIQVVPGSTPITCDVDESGKFSIPVDLVAGNYPNAFISFLSVDGNYEGGSNVSFNIVKANPQVLVDIGSDESFEIKFGDTVVSTVNVPDDATGVVYFSLDNDTWIPVTIPEGKDSVEFDIPDLDAGNYILFVKYSGDDNYNPVYSENPFTVNQLNTVVTVDPVKGKAGEKVKITARVTDEKGNPVPEGTVIIGFNGKEYKANVVNGIATVEVVLPNKAGTYSATAYYEGFNYNSSYTTFTVEVSDIPNPNPTPNPVNNGVGNMENTGNPLLVLLIALCAIGLESFRRKF